MHDAHVTPQDAPWLNCQVPGGPPTDVDLVTRCLAGDQAAWAAYVERFSRYVLAITARGCGLAEHDAEDVFQEVFARAYERLGEPAGRRR